MKFFVGLILVGLLSQSAFGQSAFEDYLLEIQYQVQSLHTRMKGTFDNVRFALNTNNDLISQETLANALTGIQNVEQIRQSTNDYLDSLAGTADADCLQTVRDQFNADVVTAGSDLSSCSSSSHNQISMLITELHNKLDEGQRTSNKVQNTVVRTMATWNPVNSADELSYIVSVELEEIANTFDTVTVPDLADTFAQIDALVNSLPQSIESCSNDAELLFRLASSGAENQASTC